MVDLNFPAVCLIVREEGLLSVPYVRSHEIRVVADLECYDLPIGRHDRICLHALACLSLIQEALRTIMELAGDLVDLHRSGVI